MSTQKVKRKKYFIDPQVQGALIRRIVTYWLGCLVALFVTLWWWSIFMLPNRPILSHMDQVWPTFGPVLFTSLLIVPLIIFDTIRLSNRFAGPMLRMRRTMKMLSEDRKVFPLHFRDNDFWNEFAEDFNNMLSRVEADRRALVIELDMERAKNNELAMALTEEHSVKQNVETASTAL
ncbi:MAG: hypothetical protein PVH19_08450 [Planctomycetia bacterium]|jgi:hypothetical protein